jgi:group I intron endonuclease
MKQSFVFILPSKDYYKPGIYCILNTKNGKKYVGSSKNMYYRIRGHLCDLRKDRHYNKHLQKSFLMYGAGIFQAFVLEFCEESQLALSECLWIEKENSMNRDFGYNQTQVTNLRKNDLTIESRRKISSTLSNGKKTWMLSKENGVLIEEHNTLVDAAVYIKNSMRVGSSERVIRQRISDAARNVKSKVGNGKFTTRTSAYGYKWRFV